MDFKRAIYIVTEEARCPLYNVGEEFQLEGIVLTTPRAKPTCLVLARALRQLMIAEEDPDYVPSQERGSHECGGCIGMLRFELKQEKGFATLPMQLLAATKKRERHEHYDELIRRLRTTTLFATLPDSDLEDLACILQVHDYPSGEVILTKGEAGARLCILLTGRVEVLSEKGSRLSVLEAGEVFGEMSLLGGTPVSSSVRTLSPCRLAELYSKDFRHLLTRYLALQIFFYRLLAERLNESNRQRMQVQAAGMTGSLHEVGMLELLQLCHTARKTGHLRMEFKAGLAEVLFHDGELVAVRYGKRQGREALFELLAQRDGRFVYASGLTPAEEALPPMGSFVALVIEGIQYAENAGLLGQ